MAQSEPLKLTSVCKSPIWGGERLKCAWGKESDAPTIGESWELTVRPDAVCTVENGHFRGQALSAVLAARKTELLGALADAPVFPILVKLIDAAQPLSVQVHPNDAYAKRVEGDRGKTELWYILEADEDAEILYGLAEGVTAKDFANGVQAGNVEALLRHQRVRAGQVYFIPSGMPHAIGKGILLAEVQQNCDLTYRVYDYNRTDANGNPRELHLQKALEVIRPFTEKEVDDIRFARGKATESSQAETLLADCPYFGVARMVLTASSLPVAQDGRMRHLLCIAGEGLLCYAGGSLPFAKGDSILLPADLRAVTARGTGEVLLSWGYT